MEANLMAGRRARPIRPVSSLSIPAPDDPAAAHAFLQIEQAVNELQASRSRTVVTTDLVIGRNRIPHGLGRPCLGYTVTATFCTIAFGHAIVLENPRPEREIWIDVVGSDQLQARVEVF